MPFYYYLGSLFPKENLLEIGFGIGLNAACYLTGSGSTKKYLAAQETSEKYYSPRIGVANVKQVYRGDFDVHVGSIYEDRFMDKVKEIRWDVALVSERKDYDWMTSCLGLLWGVVEEGGVICVDNVESHEQSRRAYRDFCMVNQRERFVFPTRYGVGLLER